MTYWQKRKKAFACAFKGIETLFSHEAHAKIHLSAAICVIVCGFIFQLEKWEWCAISLCIGGVLMAECFNTAIEYLADRVTTDYDLQIGRVKDMAAGAVLLFVFSAVAVGLVIFIPHIFR